MNLQIISPKLSEINKEQPQKNGTLEKPKPSETCPKKEDFIRLSFVGYSSFWRSQLRVIRLSTEQVTARGGSTYWAVLKTMLKKEGADELITNCKQLRMITFE